MILSVENADSVQTSLGSSGRVRYSCVGLSKSYLVLGATTGSVYFFERSSLVFVRVLSSADTQIRDPISVVRVSHSETHFAFAAKGTIYVYEIHADKSDKQLLKVTDHKDSEVTALAWSMDGTTVFSGDDAGSVMGSIISKGKFFFSADPIFKCDSRVVQLDLFSDSSSLMLLASSLTKSTILNVTKQLNTVIGKKTRDGKHGGCFHPLQGCLYLSRPQQRVWAATFEGKVTATMIFDTDFGDAEDEEEEDDEEEEEDEKKIAFALSPSAEQLSDVEPPNFGKMLPYGRFLISWDDKSLVLFDVTTGTEDVLEWRHDPHQIHDLFAADDVIAVLHGANKILSLIRHTELGSDAMTDTTTTTDMTVTPPTEINESDLPNQESAELPNPEALVSQLEQQRAEREEQDRRDKERQKEEETARRQRQEEEEAEKKKIEEEQRKEEERIKEEKQRKEEAERQQRELEEQLEREHKQEEERLEQQRLEQERREEEERQENERREREKEEQEKLERERREQQRLEQERIEKERQEQERLEREREEQERIERERQEQLRREKERLELERLEKEMLERLEQERMEMERQEQARVEKLRIERLEQERLEQQRIEKERLERIERERLEQEQLERELEQERLEQERIEKERLEKEREERERLALIETEKQTQERLEQERMEREKKEKARLEKRRLKEEKLEMERQKREQERLEKERLEKEEKEKLEMERMEKERLRKEQLEKERLEKERLEKEKIEQERLERERLEKERLEKERAEKERLEKEREKQRLEKERVEKERLEKERLEKERLEKERLEKERVEKENQQKEKERKEKEKQEKERQEREKKERLEKERLERLEKERLEKERLEQQRLEKERQEKESQEKESQEKESQEKERQEKERLEKERLQKQEKERVEKERVEKERVEKERKEIEKQEKERVEKEKKERERLEEEKKEKERQKEKATKEQKKPAVKDTKLQEDIFAEPDDPETGNGAAKPAKKATPAKPKATAEVSSKKLAAKKPVATGASIFDEEEPENAETPVAAQVSSPAMPSGAQKVIKKKKPRTATIEAPKTAKPAATPKDAQLTGDATPEKSAPSEAKEQKTTKPKTRKASTSTAAAAPTPVPEPAPTVPSEPAPTQDPVPIIIEPESARTEVPAQEHIASAGAPASPIVHAATSPASSLPTSPQLVPPTTPSQSHSISSSTSTSASNLQLPAIGSSQSTSPVTAARASSEGFSMSSISRSAGDVFKGFDRFTKKTVQQVQQIASDIQKTDKIVPTPSALSVAPPTTPTSQALPPTTLSIQTPTSPHSPSAPSPISIPSAAGVEVPPSDSTPHHWWDAATQNLTQNSLHQGLVHVWDATVHTTHEVWDATVHHTSTPATPSTPRVADPLTKITHDALVAYRKENSNKEVLLPFLRLWTAQFKPTEFPLFQLSAENAKGLQVEYSQVSDLATACFEFQIFEGPPANYIAEYFNFLDVDHVIATCMQYKLQDCFDLVFHLEDRRSPERDPNLVALERFLRDKDGYSAQALLKSAKKPLTLSARVLPQFFESSHKDAITYTVSLYPKIRPWFVEWKIGATFPRYYIEYLSQLLSVREDCRKNQNFVHSFFGYCLLQAAPNRETLFLDSRPVRGAHKREWGHAENLMEVVQNEYRVYSRNSEHLQHMCEKAGFFPGLLQLYLLHGQIRQAVDLVISTDDETGLFHVLSESSDSEMWCFAMQRIQQMRTDFTPTHALPVLESEFAITKDGFLKFMIRRLGPLHAMQLLLKETEFAKGGISHEAYKVFTTMGKIEIREKRPLVYEMLSTIDSYLWSRKPKAVCPQIRYVFELESNLQNATLQNANPQFSHQQNTLPSYLDQPSIPGTPVALKFDMENFPVFYEEATGHWGAETEFSNGTCPLCTLPLLENPEGAGLGLGSGPTVLIFPKCGHAFHGFCNENDHACSLCVVHNIAPWSSAPKSNLSSQQQYSI